MSMHICMSMCECECGECFVWEVRMHGVYCVYDDSGL